MTLQQLARALGGEVRGHQVLAPGPGHSPKDRSLAVTPSSTAARGLVVYSHAGDDPIVCKDYVREKLGLAPFEANGNPDAVKAKARIKAAYDYQNEQGELLFQVLRLEPKGFRQRRPDGNGGWHWSLGDTKRVLYRLPEIIEAVASDHPVFIAEGEKAADALARLGVTATCAPGGAGKWRDSYSEHLKGADVVILPDNDEVGEQHAKSVEASLTGVAAAKADELVRSRGLTWSDVVARPQPASTPRRSSSKGWREPETIREKIDAALRYRGLLNAWEASFLIDVKRFRHPSPKQRACIERIYRRVRAAA